MKKFWVRLMSILSMIAMLMGAATPVYAARDLVGYGTGSGTTVTASASDSESSASTTESTAASTESAAQTTGTNQKSATTSTTSVQTGVVDDSIPFVLLIAAAIFLIVTLIRSNINRKRYGNYGEYWMQQAIEYEKRWQA